MTESTVFITELDSQRTDFQDRLQNVLGKKNIMPVGDIYQTVQGILKEISQKGDIALLEYTQKFDCLEVQNGAELEVSKDRLQQALSTIDRSVLTALQLIKERVQRYHEKQLQQSWEYQETDGTILGQHITPIDRVGIYVPGGKAAYPSSVMMNTIPAKVAGVGEIIMVVPTPNGEVNDAVLAAAAVAGVDRVFTIGGAQAIGALAYGTETVPAVDKIVGPGNAYVATAKQLVFGKVGIDMIAGPSEILIICDGSTNPEWIAMDLFSQAEHDEDAQSILISTDSDFLQTVKSIMQQRIGSMERSDIIAASLAKKGLLIKVDTLEQAFELSNVIAPEHFQLCVNDARSYLPKIRHAGAIFLGSYSAEVLGDYCAGPNHVLPTSSTARFSSPLGVYDFQKRSSIIHCSQQGANELAKTASLLARCEGLTAHAQSAEYRLSADALKID